MKNIKNIVVISFLSLILGVFPLQGSQGVQSAEIAVEQVDKKMSLLDRIIEQVNSIVDSPDQAARVRAKKELTRLMKDKDLDPTIKKAIESDIKIIKNPMNRSELDAAYKRLLDTYKKINAQANVVDTIAQATEMVQNASPEELEETIAKVKQEIEQAQQERQGFLTRMYTKAKRFVTAPVDYVFGKEASYAKTAFYAAVGLAVLAAGAYATLHGIDNIKEYAQKSEPPLRGKIRDWSPAFEASIREKFGDDPEAQKEGLRKMLKEDLEPEKMSLEKKRDLLEKEHSALQKQLNKLFEHNRDFRNEDLTKVLNELELKRESVWNEIQKTKIELLPIDDYYDYYEYLTNPDGRVRRSTVKNIKEQP